MLFFDIVVNVWLWGIDVFEVCIIKEFREVYCKVEVFDYVMMIYIEIDLYGFNLFVLGWWDVLVML